MISWKPLNVGCAAVIVGVGAIGLFFYKGDSATEVHERSVEISAIASFPDDPIVSPSATLEVKPAVVGDGGNNQYQQIKEAVKAGQSDDPTVQKGIEVGAKAFSALQSKNWDALIAVSDEVQAEPPEAMEALVMHALLQNAPLDVILELLNRGANLPKNAMHILVASGQLDRIEVLENYGLDIDYADGIQGNGFNIAVKTQAKPSMFRYLLRRGVPMNVYADGKDPLAGALTDFFETGKQVGIVKFLVANGATINSTHQNIVKANKVFESRRYKGLIRSVPELASQ